MKVNEKLKPRPDLGQIRIDNEERGHHHLFVSRTIFFISLSLVHVSRSVSVSMTMKMHFIIDAKAKFKIMQFKLE
jgi:hypothetical protein